MTDKYIDVTYTDRPGGVVSKTITAAITGATAADPVVITAVAHGFADGDVVQIDGIVGMVELNDRSFVVDSAAADTFELTGEDGALHTAYTSGGIATKLLGVTGDLRVLYDDTVSKSRIVDAVQRAKEALIELL